MGIFVYIVLYFQQILEKLFCNEFLSQSQYGTKNFSNGIKSNQRCNTYLLFIEFGKYFEAFDLLILVNVSNAQSYAFKEISRYSIFAPT